MASVFVNYRSSDEPYGAMLIDQALVARFGEDNVFRDSRSIPAGTEFPPRLWQALRTCQVLVVVIGPRWLDRDATGRRLLDDPSDYVRREIAEALSLRIRVLPLLLDDAQLPGPSELPGEVVRLVQHQYRHIRRRSAEHDIERVLAEIEQWVPRKAPADRGRVNAPTFRDNTGNMTFGDNSPIHDGVSGTRRDEE